jgi:hypothetical protein
MRNALKISKLLHSCATWRSGLQSAKRPIGSRLAVPTEVPNQIFWASVSPRRQQRAPHDSSVCWFQPHAGCSTTAPYTFDRDKDFRFGFEEFCLLGGLDHGIALVGVRPAWRKSCRVRGNRDVPYVGALPFQVRGVPVGETHWRSYIWDLQSWRLTSGWFSWRIVAYRKNAIISDETFVSSRTLIL